MYLFQLVENFNINFDFIAVICKLILSHFVPLKIKLLSTHLSRPTVSFDYILTVKERGEIEKYTFSFRENHGDVVS